MAGFTEFALTAGRNPLACCLGPDGNVWYVDPDAGQNKVSKITPAGTVTEYACPDASADVQHICSDGTNLWVLGYTSNKIYKVTTSGTFTSYSTGITASAGLYNCCLGPDGNIWFTEFGGNRVGKITSGGTVTEYAVPQAASQPLGIVSDGTNLWVTYYASGKAKQIAKVTTSGSFTEYTLPSASSNPASIALGADGNLWICGYASGYDKIVKFVPSTQVGTEYSTGSGSRPMMICRTRGDLSVLLAGTQKIAVYSTSGSQVGTDAAIPTGSAGVQSTICTGADGAVWFCEYGQAKIGSYLAVYTAGDSWGWSDTVAQTHALHKTTGDTWGWSDTAVGVARTAVVKKLSGKVTYDPTTITEAKWSNAPEIAQTGVLAIVSGEVKITSGGTIYYRTITNGARVNGLHDMRVADFAISFDLHSVTAPDATYAARVGVYKDTSNWYDLLIAKIAGGTSVLRSVVSGSATTRASAAKGVAVATTKQVKFYRVGNKFGAYVDGTLIGEWTDPSPLSGDLSIVIDGVSGTCDQRFANFDVSLGNTIAVDCPSGGSARLYDSGGTVVAQAVESGGKANLDCAALSFPFTGYLQVFTDSAYTTKASQGRYPANGTATDFRGGDEYHFNLTRFTVIGSDFTKFYATTQANSHNGVVYNGDHAYGLAIGPENSVVAFDANLATGLSSLATVSGAGAISDQHGVCDLARDSQGILHALWGGYGYNAPLYYAKSNTPYGWNDWGTPTAISGAAGLSGGMVIDQADKLHLVGVMHDGTYSGAGGIKYFSKASGGSWSAATALVSPEAGGWFYLFNDITIGKEPSGQQSVTVTFNNIKSDLSVYRDLNVLRTEDGGTTWKGLCTSAYTLPLSANSTTGVVTGCEKAYSGTDAYLGRLLAHTSGDLHIIMQKLGAFSDPVYIKGTSSSWAAPSYTFAGFNTGTAIEQVNDQIAVMGAVVGTPNKIVRYFSPDQGVTWYGPTTMIEDTNTSYPPEWYWAKLTQVSSTASNLRVLWQSRNGGYTTSLGDTGEGYSSLYIADVEATSFRSSGDSWGWSDTATGPRVPYARSSSDSWAWSDAASRSRSSARGAADSWAWTDTAGGSVTTHSFYTRTPADTWAWGDTSVAAIPGAAIPLPASANFTSAGSQTADFASARSHTADFVAGPT